MIKEKKEKSRERESMKTIEKRSLLSEEEKLEKGREARREYYRKWRQEHAEQIKAYNQRYWTRKAEAAETR